MKKIALITLFSSIASILSAQDDLVDMNLVHFQSESEKKAFTAYVRKGEKDYFSLFMASGTLLTEDKVEEARDRFRLFLLRYDDSKFQTRKPERKSNQIHADLQKTFLKRYQDNASFEEIFFNGNYSDISSLGLYAIAFDHAKVPYSIRDDANELYILAYPDAEKIKLKLTMGGHALIKPTTEFKQQFVGLLRRQKVIPDDEFSRSSVLALFDKYYYGSNQIGITIPNVVGLQYYNQAVMDLQSNRFSNSFNHAEKAYLLYPSPKTSYLMAVAGTSAFQQRKQLDSIKAIQLVKLSKLSDQGVTREMIEAEFIQIAQELLFNRSDKTELDRFHRVLSRYLINFAIKNDVDFVYFYETGRFLLNRGRYTEALNHFEEAFKINPTNQRASGALINSINWKVSNTRDAREQIKILEQYQDQYPQLTEDNYFNGLVLSSYLVKMMTDFAAGNPSDGEKYRTLFAQHYAKYSDVHADKHLIGSAYSRAAFYYHRKGQKQKARAIIDAGLRQSPDNYELVEQKRMLK